MPSQRIVEMKRVMMEEYEEMTQMMKKMIIMMIMTEPWIKVDGEYQE